MKYFESPDSHVAEEAAQMSSECRTVKVGLLVCSPVGVLLPEPFGFLFVVSVSKLVKLTDFINWWWILSGRGHFQHRVMKTKFVL